MTDTPFEAEIEVGKILKAEKFEEARKPEMFKLKIDLGDKKVQSAAQLGYNHKPEKVEGKQVLCATNLGSVRIAGFKSEVLTLGVPDEEDKPVLISPEDEVPLGRELY